MWWSILLLPSLVDRLLTHYFIDIWNVLFVYNIAMRFVCGCHEWPKLVILRIFIVSLARILLTKHAVIFLALNIADIIRVISIIIACIPILLFITLIHRFCFENISLITRNQGLVWVHTFLKRIIMRWHSIRELRLLVGELACFIIITNLALIAT